MQVRGLLLALAVLAFLAFAAVFVGTREVPLLRKWVTQAASAKLDLEVDIRGRIGLGLLPRPGVVARDVLIKPREGARQPFSAVLDRVSVGLDPIDWLRDRVPRITRITLRGVRIDVAGNPGELVESFWPDASSEPAEKATTWALPGLAQLWALPDLNLANVDLRWQTGSATPRRVRIRWSPLEDSRPRRLRVNLEFEPGTTPVRVHAELARAPSGALVLEGLLAHAGASDLHARGTLSADANQANATRLKARLESQRFDLAELLRGTTTASGSEFLDHTLPLKLPPGLHAAVELDFERVDLAALPLEKLRAKLVATEERVDLSIEAATLLEGRVQGSGSIRAAAGPAGFELKLSLSQLELSKLPHDLAQQDDGKLDLELNLESQGGTLREILSELEGDVLFAMGAISSPNGRIGLLGRSVFALYFAREDSGAASRLNCAVFRSNFSKGIGTTEGLVDTENAILAVHGLLDLKDFQIDGIIKPDPKKKGLAGLGTPFQISGPIMDPEVATDKLRIAADTGKVLALGFLNPALMIASFVDLGNDRDLCAGSLASRLREPLEPQGLIGHAKGGIKDLRERLDQHFGPKPAPANAAAQPR